MVFNSVVFLFCFLPLALLAYYLVPGRGKNVVLLVESLLFYCWTGVEYLPLIVCLIVFNYLWGLLTARTKAKLKGLLPAVAVLVSALMQSGKAAPATSGRRKCSTSSAPSGMSGI